MFASSVFSLKVTVLLREVLLVCCFQVSFSRDLPDRGGSTGTELDLHVRITNPLKAIVQASRDRVHTFFQESGLRPRHPTRGPPRAVHPAANRGRLARDAATPHVDSSCAHPGKAGSPLCFVYVSLQVCFPTRILLA